MVVFLSDQWVFIEFAIWIEAFEIADVNFFYDLVFINMLAGI